MEIRPPGRGKRGDWERRLWRGENKRKEGEKARGKKGREGKREMMVKRTACDVYSSSARVFILFILFSPFLFS